MRQTWAIFVDAYRELNSRKLFWFVLLLSIVVVGAFAAVGINDKGLTVFGWTIPSMVNAHMFPPALFYKMAFANLGVKFWLAWCSTILALIATAGIFPDLVSSGSIELTLSRPISRLRLFFTKYLAGLLFTATQVTAFTFASFLVLGTRGGVWEPGIFWAVPLMVVFFSYLFCMCVLLGLWMRSTVAALLITLLLWFAAFGVHLSEQMVLTVRESNAVQQERLQRDIQTMSATLDLYQKNASDPSQPLPKLGQDMQNRMMRQKKKLDEKAADGKSIQRWHLGIYAFKTVLPKTTETLQVLDRVLVSQADLDQLKEGKPEPMEVSNGPDDVPTNMQAVADRVQDIQRNRSIWWIIGTSLGFEAFILGIAAWMFCHRDF
jgi:ABC-type transport system involved in multi-copper enzyme maturation permease subunit